MELIDCPETSVSNYLTLHNNPEDRRFNLNHGLSLKSQMKANWIGHISNRNCLLRHTIVGKIEGTGRQKRTPIQLLDDLKERRKGN
jgi:hypothetical protein